MNGRRTRLPLRWAIPAAVLLCLAGEGVAAAAPVRFRAATVYDIPSSDFGRLAVADLNHDGRSDLVAMDYDPNRPLTVLLAGPGGRLARSSSVDLQLPDPTSSNSGLALPDVNGDGHRDLVAVALEHTYGNDEAPTVVVVLLGNGRGGFSGRRVTRAGCCGAGGFSVSDFNRDGKADLAIAYAGVLLGDGTGRFPGRGAGQLDGVANVAVDLNRDRRADLVVLGADEDPDPMGFRLGRGNGHFAPFQELPAGDVASVAVGRFDRDPWPDLAAVTWLAGDDVLAILRGTRTGRPRLARARRVGSSPQNVKAADFNGDRKLDLVVRGFAGRELRRDHLRVLLGTGRGSFGVPIPVSSCCPGLDLEVGDFDGDRRPDLLTSSFQTAPESLRIAVRLNATPR